MDSDTLIPALAIVCIFGAPIAAWIISRVLAHRERMEMLRHGIVPPANERDMRRAMKHGWSPNQSTAPAANQYAYQADYYAQYQLRRGIQVACVGFALLVGLSFIGYHDGHYEVGAWLLGGLVPLFVGVAQIINAVLSGATFGVPAAQRRFGPTFDAGAPPEKHSAGSAVPPGPTYGGWRPGSIPEIEKPASPPDYRA
jgi:hypothetical protein